MSDARAPSWAMAQPGLSVRTMHPEPGHQTTLDGKSRVVKKDHVLPEDSVADRLDLEFQDSGWCFDGDDLADFFADHRGAHR